MARNKLRERGANLCFGLFFPKHAFNITNMVLDVSATCGWVKIEWSVLRLRHGRSDGLGVHGLRPCRSWCAAQKGVVWWSKIFRWLLRHSIMCARRLLGGSGRTRKFSCGTSKCPQNRIN